MDYTKKFKQQLFFILFLGCLAVATLAVAVWYVASSILFLDFLYVVLATSASAVIIIICVALILQSILAKSVTALVDTIVYAGHSSRGGVAPDMKKLWLGRELLISLSLQVFDMASIGASSAQLAPTQQPNSTVTQTTAASLPQSSPVNQASMFDLVGVPLIGIDGSQKITLINRRAAEYFGTDTALATGKPLFDVLSLSFQGDETFEDWLKTIKQSAVTGTRQWERVRHTPAEGEQKQFDLVSSFSSGNQSGTETMLAIFDRTTTYNQDDQEIAFVALAVHELRTPLTIMRGYIEVFEDELGPSLQPEHIDFMHKMHASAQQLTAFVGNILNVARIEENQLVLKLQEEDWAGIIKTAVADLELRARVHGKHIEVQLADGLPRVGVDRISSHEVINNLVDNAIKYSGTSDKIIIKSTINSDGLVETSVQDFGIGIPEPVMKDLFQKFYRSHKSRVQVGGTGLGLYLCKSLVTAMGGNIWVRSKEGEGSIFTFTVQPYDRVRNEQNNGQDGIMRGAHGWIKNHSLYRQ